MSIYTKHYNTKKTKQTSPIPGKNQMKNDAGGYVYQASHWDKLTRFLILGSEGGTYYASEQKLTVEGAANVIKCIKENGDSVVDIITNISTEGRAPKNDAAIFALALCCTHGDQVTKARAYTAITKVCRIGTHIFTFCEHIQAMRGWSRGIRTAVSNFYVNKPLDKLAYDVIKYRQRNGWTHRDVLRLAHPKALTNQQNFLFKYIVGKSEYLKDLPLIINAFESVSQYQNINDVVETVTEYKLPREALDTKLLSDSKVWEALLENMPITAMVRNLGKMTSLGMFEQLNKNTKNVINSLTNADSIKKARLHPMNILNALKVYQSGQGVKGNLTWTPSQRIIDALNQSFYMAFKNVEPTGKHLTICVDTSGSMGSQVSGLNMSCREAAFAMALVTAATEPDYALMGFDSALYELPISPKQRLDDVLAKCPSTSNGTDCALPILYAMQKQLKTDAFVMFTDSQTWAGDVHVSQALNDYRNKVNPKAKLVVAAMASNECTIADPEDVGSLNVAGFDTAVPELINSFLQDYG